MDHLTIRRATELDVAALALVGAATFLDTYAERIAGPDIVAHAAGKHSEAFYAKCLSDTFIHIWIAQTATGAVIGYLLLGPATLPAESPQADDLEIVRIYVLSRFQKTGAGYRLMQQAIAEAQNRHTNRLVLGVYHGNEKALAFYARQGFEQIGTRSFTVGSTIFHDYVLGKTLNPPQ
jgi:ribosomal protein S18 acetylase RimI-like enzyme